MTTRRVGPRINEVLFARMLAERLPAAVISPGTRTTVLVEGTVGAYTLNLTTEVHDGGETASVDVALTHLPGSDEALPVEDAIWVPHGTHSLTSDFGARLRVDHSALARQAATIIKTFEAQSPTLSAGAST